MESHIIIGIEGVSPLRKRFTIVIGLIEPVINDCGSKNMRQRKRGRQGRKGEKRRREAEGGRRREGEEGEREREKGEKKGGANEPSLAQG